jgi:hypothetical protein
MQRKKQFPSPITFITLISVGQFFEKCSNNIIPNGFRLKWKMNLDSCKEKQLSVKEILDETSGKLIGCSVFPLRFQYCTEVLYI